LIVTQLPAADDVVTQRRGCCEIVFEDFVSTGDVSGES
jgi:hypothetical protein